MSSLTSRILGSSGRWRREVGSAPEQPSPLEVESPDSEPATAWGLFAALLAFVLTVVISPAVASKTFTPKFLVVVVLAGTGIVPLLVSLKEGRQRLASLGAVGFLLIGFVSAILSSAPGIGIFGLYGWGTGWLMWLGAAGAYGLGLRLSRRDVEWLFGGLVAGALANSVLALYQTLGNPTSATFGPYQGNQADGFLGNPVFLESLLLGVIAVVAVRAARRRIGSGAYLACMASLGLMAVALEFSTERVAVGLLALLFVALVVRYRAKGLLVSLPIAFGYLIGYLGGGSDLGKRISQGTGSVGYHQRLALWRIALQAVVHRPVFGYGPGQLEAATNPRMSLSFARTLQPGKIFTDSHDVLIEVLVTTGVLGLVAFICWVGGALSRARNPLVLFALMCLAVELVEPLNIAITPLLFLSLGACSLKLGAREPAPQPSAPLGALARAGVALLVAGALAVGAEMVVGDIALKHAPPREYSISEAKRANSLLFYWPESAIALTDYYRYEAAATHQPTVERHFLELALSASQASESRLPSDPLVWVNLGDSELALKNFGAARLDYRRALRDDQWASAAYDGLAQVDVERHQFAAAVRWYHRELAVLPPGVSRTGIHQRIRDAEDGVLPPPSV